MVLATKTTASKVRMSDAAGRGDVGEHFDGAAHIRRDAGPAHHRAAAEPDTEETEHAQGKSLYKQHLECIRETESLNGDFL